MNSKDKALKIAVTTIGILAISMIAYYWISWRTRTTENDVNFHEKVDAATIAEEKSDFSGIYSSAEPIEGMNRRLGFFSVNRKEDGSYNGSAKLDTVSSTEDATAYLNCEDVKIGEKEFFLKCAEPELGQISFVGEWQRGGSGAIQVAGKLMWSKDGTVVVDKPTTLNRPAN